MSEASDPSRLLIVDDEAPHMQALCDTLRARGFHTVGATSAAAALQALRENRFELMLTDLMMPQVDGIALVESARSIDADLACVIMTGEGTIESAVRAMKVGALDYVIKPFKVSSILPVLVRALETRDLRIRNAALELRLQERAVELQALNRDLELARHQAESANQAKSVFLSNMSHELRTPLNAILGFSQILTADALPSSLDDKRKFANHILQSGRHLLTLINEILDLAKVESGAMSLSLEAVNVADMFAECETMIGPLAQARGIALEFEPAGADCVLADRTRLKQILVNLLSNAVKYNREHGAVLVSSCCDGARGVRLAVKDTGSGLDAGQLGEIFQPFNRLGREGLHEEGTGIGLVLTKSLVEAMGGQIGIDSQPGIGSTFWVRLPGCEAAALPRAAAPTLTLVTSAPPLPRRSVLYIEDNPTNLQLITELLRLRGDLDMLSATDGQSGVELARARLPHLILLDINLPDMDGFAVRRILRNDPRTADIPVIAVSASAMPRDLRRGAAAGFFRYITKPIDIGMFSEAVDDALALGYPTGPLS
jgi:signal transduction histidine kinase